MSKFVTEAIDFQNSDYKSTEDGNNTASLNMDSVLCENSSKIRDDMGSVLCDDPNSQPPQK